MMQPPRVTRSSATEAHRLGRARCARAAAACRARAPPRSSGCNARTSSRGSPAWRSACRRHVDHRIGSQLELAPEDLLGDAHRQRAQLGLRPRARPRRRRARADEQLGHGGEAPLAPLGLGLAADALGLVARGGQLALRLRLGLADQAIALELGVEHVGVDDGAAHVRRPIPI